MDIEKAKEKLKLLKEYKCTYYGYQWFKVEVCADDEMKEVIETVLNELEKKDTVIDLLADDLRYYEGMQQDQLFCIDTCEGKMCDEEHCKERIKEYFYKKVE